MEYLAHRRENGETQTLKNHLEQTAQLAGKFASAFESEEAGRTAGLLHDIGKYSEQFQKRIRGSSLRVDHSTAGAQTAWEMRLLPIAFSVAGHHSGLPDGGSGIDSADEATMVGRSKKKVPDYHAWKDEIRLPKTQLPIWVTQTPDLFTQSFFIRMLYSCLVDADFLDTEAFMQGSQPRGGYDSLPVLLQRLHDNKIDHWLNTTPTTQLNETRTSILQSCMEAGRRQSGGLYTLTVPTGGGKTIASLTFALEHAVSHNLERVIYVIPYTSIIDQTSSIFQDILGKGNVLAHYAEASFQLGDREDLSPAEYRQALAAENWDAPIIVTTAVQFFESLYANRSSRCRKLHNIARSVVIFDEAQTIPIPYLRPCTAAIVQLIQHYHVTAVLCTATQPELSPLFQEYHLSPTEICPNPASLYQTLRRTVITDLGAISPENLTERLSRHSQVLCVVNRRRQAQELYSSLPKDGSYCLTTLLCPSDRKLKLNEIRRRLKAGLPCRVISTSLIEAGVDVDFPAAYREEAGLDSILQTAGRCNREGNEKDPNRRPVYLFRLEETKPLTAILQQITALRAAQRKHEELDQPEAIAEYFQTLLYRIKDKDALDVKGVIDAFSKTRNGNMLPFETIANEFSLIDSPVKTIYIPTGKGATLCDRLRNGESNRSLFRKLGPYSVSVYENQWNTLYEGAALEVIDPYTAVLIDLNQYDAETGLKMESNCGQALFL